jgi:hypothetical protein
MKDLEMLLNMPKDQRIALRNIGLVIIVSLILQSFFK